MVNAYNLSNDIRKMAHPISEFNVVGVADISLCIHGIESGSVPERANSEWVNLGVCRFRRGVYLQQSIS